MKIAIYVRVSDDKKKSDGERRQDIQRQIDLLKSYFNLNEKEIEIYKDDNKTAFTDDINQRPDFKRMIIDVRRNYIRQIYIEDMTRFARNLHKGLQWLKELGEYGATITSMKEGEIEVTSNQGWMQSSILLMLAEYSSRIQSEKVKSGMQRAKKKICESCGIAHLGRHSKKCKCERCLKRK
jgi:DNA invertase Pin-like site-specific DNA recombinase